jgi:rRNA maturation endonuclease Nob1
MKDGLTFYRCTLCRNVVSKWDIDKGGCQRCGGTKISPTNLTLIEKVKEIVKRPAVWRW